MNKALKHVLSSAALLSFLFIAFGSMENEEKCGCPMPDVSIPSYADSWDDKKENWAFVECAIAESKELTEKIHVYVFYNEKINSYRCELKYSWPGNDCRLSSKFFGSNAISTAEIANSTFQSGEWKTFEYWLKRNLNS